MRTCGRSFKARRSSLDLSGSGCDIRSSMSCSALRRVRHRRRRDLWGVLAMFFSHFREKKGAPLRGIIQARSSALRDGRGIEGTTGSCPYNHGHPPREALGRNRRKKEGRTSCITTDPESDPLLEAGLGKGTEALGHVTNYTSKRVRR